MRLLKQVEYCRGFGRKGSLFLGRGRCEGLELCPDLAISTGSSSSEYTVSWAEEGRRTHFGTDRVLLGCCW